MKDNSEIAKMTTSNGLVNGMDIPIVRLLPRNERKVGTKYTKRIEASLRAVGLLEPLIVFPYGENFEILDGCLRYRILLEMGVETVPCLIGGTREAFTGNRMVNQLSSSQEMKMLRKSLEELDERTIANALGMNGINHRLNPNLLNKLDPSVVKAFESSKLNLTCVKEFAHVKADRQAEILQLMESCNDFSVTFVRGLILKTPVSKRTKTNASTTPWTKADERKSDLLRKLRDAEQQQDFYSGLYRQYTTNLLKLVIYVRSLLANLRIKQALKERHPQVIEMFEQIVNSTER